MVTDAAAGAAGLTPRGRFAGSQDSSDLGECETEHVVQDQRDSLRWTQLGHHDLERGLDVTGQHDGGLR